MDDVSGRGGGDAAASDLDGAAAGRGAHPADRHVGLRIRMRRTELRLSQEKLAQALGLTFQQVQKYERAANRVSASKLWEVARVLKTNVAYFYEGLAAAAATAGRPEDEPPSAAETTQDDAPAPFLSTSEGAELATTFPRIARAHVRRQILELVHSLAEDRS
ncbi:transcriptional regulator [Phenylobacterium hankyongense]|uniref:Transcriptional regulator n=1 Tax=Phenylobacterium hankyongense TaxID=1813876 RepID=A0A328B1W0_9CAUL|nr:helix-turn-helix transcriptional regulator [Phenylobacterium hankyongense]RAK60787.1 transcriptional regulator [Phenylobacterium hankyongense]